ncbi:NACHT, LRR and PYD domains-containing protein 12-like, partial [Colossoma macropomum]|uniref:NACHT, LRR and PYD domains-containing protein 12-like n=1 Tax=Colossoma macropomum TaxID=42526 RepID=UPI001864F596
MDEYIMLKYIQDPSDKITKLLDIILDKGYSSCLAFLDLLKEDSVNESSPELREWRAAVNSSVQAASSTTQPGGATNTSILNEDAHRKVESEKLKQDIRKRCETLYEGTAAKGRHNFLNEIYTELYVVKDRALSMDHEVIQIEAGSLRHATPDTPIKFSDVFSGNCNAKKVLTLGIAGIGKTVSAQKFALDWAEGKGNADLDFVFIIPFRELNLLQDKPYSLHGLLLCLYPKLKNLKETGLFDDKCKCVFIFDGLDEIRKPESQKLNFEQNKMSATTEKAAVHVLITNLITGALLPSAVIWITSRPAAAEQIPLKHIHLVTEVRGFVTDQQKEKYFRNRISDKDQASIIISHIKQSKTLYNMCYIPVFSWITCFVFQQTLERCNEAEVPKTLTEMYTHFLTILMDMRSKKCNSHQKDTEKLLESSRTMILKLGELAFKQLMKGNVMFHEKDLRECGIDVAEASEYSGICNEIFKEESLFYQRKVYCFVHLTFQEFLAALYVFYCYMSKNMKVLKFFTPRYRAWSENGTLHELLKGAVDKTLECPNGHLDLFLRFLLGSSLESNQRLLQGLLTHIQSSSSSINKAVEYIRKQIESGRFTTEKSISLFLCLSEVNDQSLSTEIQEYLKSEKHSKEKLSPGQCSALACMLLITEEVMDELDLKRYNTSSEGYRRLIPAVTNCRKARLSHCNLNMDSCESLCFTLKSVNSPLRELDLSSNDLRDSGVEQLSVGLKSSLCKLEILRLSGCMVTDEGCFSLASGLKSNPYHLRELDLTYNHPGDSGVNLLFELLENPRSRLETLRVEHGGNIRMTPGLKKYACELTLDPNTAHKRLCLSNENRKV